jgi:hypothetical protein
MAHYCHEDSKHTWLSICLSGLYLVSEPSQREQDKLTLSWDMFLTLPLEISFSTCEDPASSCSQTPRIPGLPRSVPLGLHLTIHPLPVEGITNINYYNMLDSEYLCPLQNY